MNTSDEQRFTELYREHHPSVQAYVRRRLDGAHAVDDVVADVFLTAWRRLHEVPGEAVLPWLYATAQRLLANARRGEQRRVNLVETVARQRSHHVSDPADDVTGQLAVAAAFDALRQQDRDVLSLALWEGLTARQAATALGCATATYHVRLHRARTRLRQQLAASSTSTSTAQRLTILGGVDA
ncbi:RNA polymerase sigma factor [Streptomyces sp. NPDC048208]|uniref:RNA polymerase sigma factor n=1 Tax=Streptomyces sp. NPDC048208 TaxID=3365515 RepID=UPI003721C061